MAKKETNSLFLGCDKSKRVRSFITSLIFILFIVGQSTAQNVTIEGSVILGSSQKVLVSTSMGAYQNVPSGRSLSAPSVSSKSLVLWLESDNNEEISYQEKQASKKRPVLDQVDKRFKPRLMLIKAGDEVRIRNSDPVYHNVFSLSQTKRFDVGRRSPDDYQDVKFDTPGKVDVFCDIHSDMHAVIMVAPKETVAMKKLKSAGKFRFTNIPQGHYTLHLYALGDRNQVVEIDATGEENITLPTIRLGS